MSSEYPTAIDPELPRLRGQLDMVTPDVLDHVADMLKAVQTGLGNRPADLSELDGGLDFGTLTEAIFQLSRVQTGRYGPSSIADEDDLAAVKVNFDNRFSIPPFVFIQIIRPRNGSNQIPRFLPRNVEESSFQVATERWALTTAYTYNLEFDWLAIEPPFGVEAEA